MGTMTLIIDDDAEKKFRERAAHIYGKKKGVLGKAASEALVGWAESEEEVVEKALNIIEKGMKLPDWHYTKRSELYEGSHRY